MRRGFVIVGAVLLVLAVTGIGVGAYHAGEAHGVAQQLATTGEGTQVVHVVDDYGYRWGHGGFFPFGFFLFPLLLIGTFLLVRGALWRGRPWGGGGWGPGGHHGPGGSFGPGGPREEWRARAEEWHRSMHEGGEQPASDRPGHDPGPAPAGPMPA
jgi:hypothetical protein